MCSGSPALLQSMSSNYPTVLHSRSQSQSLLCKSDDCVTVGAVFEVSNLVGRVFHNLAREPTML